MTNATLNSQTSPGMPIRGRFNPGHSPLLGIVAIAAAALTMGATILLPAQQAPSKALVAATAQKRDAQVSTQVVSLPAIEVVGTRATKSADSRWTLPAIFKKS
ncbi:MAG: hypothetical protein ABI607_03615 [Betaproteobacteria bacterium]